MKFIQKFKLALLKNADFIESKDGSIQIQLPKVYKVKYQENNIEIFDKADLNFYLQVSYLTGSSNIKFDIHKEFQKQKLENHNAEIQNTGKYDCVCSATVTEDRKIIVYTWTIGLNNKIVLVTLTTTGRDDREKIDARIYSAGKIIAGIDIVY